MAVKTKATIEAENRKLRDRAEVAEKTLAALKKKTSTTIPEMVDEYSLEIEGDVIESFCRDIGVEYRPTRSEFSVNVYITGLNLDVSPSERYYPTDKEVDQVTKLLDEAIKVALKKADITNASGFTPTIDVTDWEYI